MSTIKNGLANSCLKTRECASYFSNIRYYKSQPWGFGANLIFGAFCDIEGSTEISIHDTNEIAEAAWFTRDEIHMQYYGVSITAEMMARFKYGEDFENYLEV